MMKKTLAVLMTAALAASSPDSLRWRRKHRGVQGRFRQGQRRQRGRDYSESI